MDETEYKKYTIQAKRGIKGEAFFESIISDYSLAHRIVGSKDVGIDYICEWVYKDRPSGILFAVQIKTFSESTANPKFINQTGYNGLAEYEIHNSDLKIAGSTLTYWKGLGIPVYLFAIVQRSVGESSLDCYYKRYTPLLSGDSSQDAFGPYYQFYLVNQQNTFIAFNTNGRGGFARDLFVDHVRLTYQKGSLIYVDPKILGLEEFEVDLIFEDLLKIYNEPVLTAYRKTGQYLKQLGYI